jgi:hypothetical protein
MQVCGFSWNSPSDAVTCCFLIFSFYLLKFVFKFKLSLTRIIVYFRHLYFLVDFFVHVLWIINLVNIGVCEIVGAPETFTLMLTMHFKMDLRPFLHALLYANVLMQQNKHKYIWWASIQKFNRSCLSSNIAPSRTTNLSDSRNFCLRHRSN